MTRKGTKLKAAMNVGEERPDCNFVDKLAFDGKEDKGGGSEDLDDGGNVKGEGGGGNEERDGSDGEEEDGGGKHKLGWAGKDEQSIKFGHSW